MKSIWGVGIIATILVGCTSPEGATPALEPESQSHVDSPMRHGEGPGSPGGSSSGPNTGGSPPSGTNPSMDSDLSGGIQQAAKGQARKAAAAAGAGSMGAATEADDE